MLNDDIQFCLSLKKHFWSWVSVFEPYWGGVGQKKLENTSLKQHFVEYKSVVDISLHKTSVAVL